MKTHKTTPEPDIEARPCFRLPKKFTLNRNHAVIITELLADRIRPWVATNSITPAGPVTEGTLLLDCVEIKCTPKHSRVTGATQMPVTINEVTHNLGRQYKLTYLPGRSGISFTYMGIPVKIHFNTKQNNRHQP